MQFDTPDHTGNFNRPPRIHLSEMPDGEINIPAPPRGPDLPPTNLLVTIIPVMGIGVMALFFVLRTVSGSSGSWLIALPLIVLAGITVGGSIFAHRLRKEEHLRAEAARRQDYLRLLERKKARLHAANSAFKAILERSFRHPQAMLDDALNRDASIWERRPHDGDFAALRIGTGRLPSPVRITTSDPDRDDTDIHTRARNLADAYRYVEDVPITISLLEEAPLGIHGSRAQILGTARSILCHLALTHAPQDLHIHLFSTGEHSADWGWLSWLPHVSREERSLEPDLLAFEPAETRDLLGFLSQSIDSRQSQDAPRTPFLLVVFDGMRSVEHEAVISRILQQGPQHSAAAICLATTFEGLPGECTTIVESLDTGRLTLGTSTGSTQIEGTADTISRTAGEHLSRALAGIQTATAHRNDRVPRTVDFLDLYNARHIEALADQLAVRWQREVSDGVLPFPVPIGRESLAVDTLLALDDDHHGPHGVLAGTTGSGKSELLQTLICALALEHDPRLANFLLIDFKGGSTFNLFARLPHTVGMVTNLDGALVKRVLEALKAETEQRQQFLKQMNVRDITQYHRFYGSTPAQFTAAEYHPLPHLFIIVDEFAQLAKELPDFLSELVRTAQVGRSLGLHLILGTQSPMDVITDEMNDNLQFRICLRVQNAEASRAMLRRPDAAYLPSGQPGRGYFQVGERGLFRQFQTAYAGADYVPRADDNPETSRMLQVIQADGQAIDLLPQNNRASLDTPETRSVAGAVVEAIRQYASTHQIPAPDAILLPPLTERIGLDAVHVGITGGWNGDGWQTPRDADGQLIPVGSAPIGVIDDVYRRKQYPLWMHFPPGGAPGHSSGHALISGGVGTGKTTALRTLLLVMALLHPPQQLHMYIVSMMGGGLNDLGDLPHAQQVIHGTQPERVRRVLTRLVHTIERRQSGEDSEQPVVLLAIDQFEAFRDAFYDPHMPTLERLINEGHGVGVYVVLVSTSITTVPERLRSLMPQRIALALSNPTDYTLAVGPLHSAPPQDLPRGRGFVPGNPPLTCQICLPARAPHLEDDAALSYLRATIKQMNSGAPDGGPVPVNELPRLLSLGELPPEQTPELITPLGLCDDDTLSTFALDWAQHGPHFLVVGRAGTGKTSLLHTAALSAARQRSPKDLRMMFIDFTGRSFRMLAGLKHSMGYITNEADLTSHIAALESEFKADSVGTTTVIMIDNYDLLSETLGPANPALTMLRDLARLPAERGVHIWAAGYFERIGDPLLRQLLLTNSAFGFGGRDSLYALHLRPTSLPADPMPPGRSCFAQYNRAQVIQIAASDPSQDVETINMEVWPEARAIQQLNIHDTPQAGRNGTDLSRSNTAGIDTEGLIQDLLSSEGEA